MLKVIFECVYKGRGTFEYLPTRTPTLPAHVLEVDARHYGD